MTSQSQRACRVTSGATTSQPVAAIVYTVYLSIRTDIDPPCDETERGTPRTMLRQAANEKLSTDMTEMIVDERHRLRPFSTEKTGASPSPDLGRKADMSIGDSAKVAAMTNDD